MVGWNGIRCDLPFKMEPHTGLAVITDSERFISFHTGMLNGQTAIATGKFPMWVSETDKYVDDGVFFGRYRKGQVKL